MNYIDNIESEINTINSKISKLDKKNNIVNWILKIVGYCFIGMTGSFVVNSIKNFFNGGLLSMIMFFGTFGIYCLVCHFIESNYQDKKSRLSNELIDLYRRKEKYEKSNHKSLNMNIGNVMGYNPKLKLSLKK